LVSNMAPPAPRNRHHNRDRPSTARALVLEPRIAVLRALRMWAAEHPLDANDLAAMDRVIAVLAAASDGPNLDLVMRAARRRVIVQARASHAAPEN